MHPSSLCDRSAWPLMSTRHGSSQGSWRAAARKGGSALLINKKRKSNPDHFACMPSWLPSSPQASCVVGPGVKRRADEFVKTVQRSGFACLMSPITQISRASLSVTVLGRSRFQIRKRAIAYLGRDPNSSCRARRSVRVKTADSLDC